MIGIKICRQLKHHQISRIHLFELKITHPVSLTLFANYCFDLIDFVIQHAWICQSNERKLWISYADTHTCITRTCKYIAVCSKDISLSLEQCYIVLCSQMANRVSSSSDFLLFYCWILTFIFCFQNLRMDKLQGFYQTQQNSLLF